MSDKRSPLETIAFGAKHRNAAVAAALELIKADVAASNGSLQLATHLDSLSEYADKIEEALRKA